MKTGLEIISCGQVDEIFSAKIGLWIRELIDRVDRNKIPSRISVFLWEKSRDYEDFDVREKTELGVATGGESDFLATHEAWRGFPRIHIPLEKIKDLSEEFIQGIVQHEVGHALLHGNPEFYQFRFSGPLQEAARQVGLDLPMIKQLVYLLSVAIKDEEVIRLLSELGFGFFQSRLLEYLLEETEKEQRIWGMIRNRPALRLLGMAVFLKALLPIESVAALRLPEAGPLIEKWEAAYSWLSDRERRDLRAFARLVARRSSSNFQDRLEQAVLRLIGQTALSF